MQSASSALIAALKASLADTNAQWAVTGYSSSLDTTVVSVGGLSFPFNSSNRTTIYTVISLSAPPVALAVGSAARMKLTYTSVSFNGVFDHGEIAANGYSFVSEDTALDAQVRALVATPHYQQVSHAATTGGTAGSSNTYVNESLALGANNIITALGMFANTAGTYTLKIAKQVSSGVYNIVVDTGAVVHPGGGWFDFPITPWTVPNTGTYYMGVYVVSGTTYDGNTTDNEAYAAGDVGISNGNSFTEQGAVGGFVQRATYETPSAAIAAVDASLTAALVAGPVTPAADPLLIPSDLLTNLKATLADTNAHWECRSRSESVTLNPDGSTTKLVVMSFAVPLIETPDGKDYEPYVRLAPGTNISANFGYLAYFDVLGTLTGAEVTIDSTTWRTGLDATLNTTLMAMGAAYLTAQHTSLTTALSAGPQ